MSECSGCGRQARKGARFCDFCGAPVAAPLVPAAAAPVGVGWRPPARSGGAAQWGPTPAARSVRPLATSRRVPRSSLRTALAVFLSVLLVPTSWMLVMAAGAALTGEFDPEDTPFAAIPAAVTLLLGWAAVRAWRGRVLRGDLVGEVRGLRDRSEPGPGDESWTVLSFRLERYDDAGNRLTPVPVELRGTRFTGALSEGDWVEVDSRGRHEECVRVRAVFDATTGTVIAGLGPGFGRTLGTVFGWLVLSVLLGVVVLFVVAVLR